MGTEVDWKMEYLNLMHVSKNLQLALQQDLKNTPERRRNADKYVETLGKQLEALITRIPDNEFEAKG